MMLWALGASPAVSLFLHGAAIVLTTRMFYVMGRYGASSVGDALWVGGFSGLIGATLTQLLLHMSNVHSPLSTAFSGYGQLGAVMFRLDMLSAWWPYALIFWSGAAYASWGAVVWF
jgi:hypothetical protein